jgi:hypothetical protein
MALLAACLVVLANAQESVVSKPLEQWSKQDAERILNNSPWAVVQEVRIKYAGQTRPVAGGNQPVLGAESSATYVRTDQNTINSSGAEAPVDFQFTLRLRSALPVRQALVKLKQLEAKYSQMSEKDRTAFDAKTRGLLECPACSNNYVLTLSSKSKQNPGADAVFSLYKGGRLEDLQRYVYIANDRGERRTLAHFVAPKVPGDEATFFFPRFDDKGTPLLTEYTKGLVFNLSDNEVNAVTNFKIEASKLILNGRVEF